MTAGHETICSVFKFSQIQPYHTPRIALEHVPQTATRTDHRVVDPVRIVHFKAAKRKAAILNPHGVSAAVQNTPRVEESA
jgi:hypothetical protein